MRHIRIAYRCLRQPDGRWLPGYQLTVVGDDTRVLPMVFESDRDKTFATKAGAEAIADVQARHWCARNYPGWPVQPT